MKTKIKVIAYLLLMGFLTLGSCAKDGEDGAIGPQGPQGEQGISGEDGEDGQDASANNLVTTADVFAPVLDLVVGSSILTQPRIKCW